MIPKHEPTGRKDGSGGDLLRLRQNGAVARLANTPRTGEIPAIEGIL